MPDIKIKRYQTLLDFATQNAGDASQVIAVALANGVSITDDIDAGSLLSVDVVNTSVQQYFVKNAVDVTTQPATIEGSFEGVGYWEIENDFIIQ